jgi:putative nucleotidyltransferase with HDIG domain
MSQSTHPTKWLFKYINSITLIGGVIILLALVNLPDDWIGLFIFGALAGLVELLSVELFASSRSRVSVSSIIAMASIPLFGPWGGVLTHMFSGIMTIITTTLRSEQPEKGRVSWFRRSAFNIGMWVISAAVAGWTYTLLGGSIGNITSFSNILPFIGCVTTDTLLNAVILIGVITLQTRRHPYEIWKRDFQWSAPIQILGGVIGGGFLALAYVMFGFPGLVIFTLPIVATSYSFRIYVNNMKDYVTQLEDLNRDLEATNLGLLETLGAVMDAYDVYTYGHSTQVATYAAAITDKMDLTTEEKDLIIRAALVHDIGKIGVLDSIVGKQGKLTDEEFRMIKRHPIIGSEIISQMKGLQDLVPLVMSHHERWDGKGYPDGLEGADIPKGARILALADSLDAMLSDRPYRPTRGLEDVIEEIARCSGAQFDPDVVVAFNKLVGEKERSFFKNSAVYVDSSLQMINTERTAKGMRYLKKSMVIED